MKKEYSAHIFKGKRFQSGSLIEATNHCLPCNKIQGLNMCIVRTISSIKEVGPSRIEIRNLTKNSSWTYHPIVYVLPQDSEFKYGDEVVVWLSHWMFVNNEFENGDEVSIHFSLKYRYPYKGVWYGGEDYICYGGEGPEYANVREYGISPVYDNDDDGGGGGKQKDEPWSYYKSWKHIIGWDLPASSSHLLGSRFSNPRRSVNTESTADFVSELIPILAPRSSVGNLIK
ncbi:hypothetical protein Hdeb2414_s0007g00248991 [Helianthus debilis subsp. tardiflorus]